MRFWELFEDIIIQGLVVASLDGGGWLDLHVAAIRRRREVQLHRMGQVGGRSRNELRLFFSDLCQSFWPLDSHS